VALREYGAEVRVCAPPDEDFARRLDEFGVPVVPVGWSAKELTKSKPKPSSVPQRAAELIAAQFEAVTEAAEGCDIVVSTGMAPTAAGAVSVAEKLGVPAVSATFQQLTLPSPYRGPLEYPGRPHPPEITDNRVLWELDEQSIQSLFGDALNSSREAAGLPPVDSVRGHLLGSRPPLLATDPVLDPWREPALLEVVQTGAWLTPDERPLPDGLAEFLDAGEPPVYVGFGSMPMHTAGDVAGVAVEAVRAQGRRLLIGSGWADLTLVDGQDDCFVVGEVSHQALFPRVAAVVHHGGAGTTTAAARAGAPQVVVPQLADQPYWAGRVAELGIGAAHDGPVPGVASLSEALGAALAPGVRERASAVAGTVRTDGAAMAAKLLYEMVS
jgi:vancomycin aglycone glucosyltransferase